MCVCVWLGGCEYNYVNIHTYMLIYAQTRPTTRTYHVDDKSAYT